MPRVPETRPTRAPYFQRLSAGLGDHLGFLLAQAHHGAVAVADRTLAPLNLEIDQYVALAILADEGPISQHQLGQRMGIDRTTMVALIDGLETAGHVRHERNPEDRRAYALQITRQGRAALARAQRAVTTAEREIAAALTDAEVRQLKDLLNRLLAA